MSTMIGGHDVDMGTGVDYPDAVVVDLPGYQCGFRVLGIYRGHNPNGLPGRFTYVRAEWRLGSALPERWLPVRDLKTLMRLANKMIGYGRGHGLPYNRQPYAQVNPSQR